MTVFAELPAMCDVDDNGNTFYYRRRALSATSKIMLW